MPFYLKPRDLSADVANVRSALIVPCRFCPPASFAVREKRPFIDLFRSFLKTAAYEEHIRALRSELSQVGVETAVFDSRLAPDLIVCMWTAGRRERLRRRARSFDAVVVLGCDAAVRTAEGCTENSSCRVVRGLEIEGLMNVIPRFRFPGTISLELSSVTRVLEYPPAQA